MTFITSKILTSIILKILDYLIDILWLNSIEKNKDKNKNKDKDKNKEKSRKEDNFKK